ncbi:II family cellulose-binding protein [Alcanivorax sp. N3-2A]|nr:II family cellulose-binding protein [Alcanivorax sp. N3-2A]
MTLTTPALLFPAISLLLLAYTNRFLVLAQLIRKLADEEKAGHQEVATLQIEMLNRRVVLTQRMQVAGVLSFLLCTLSMFALYLHLEMPGVVLFGASLITLSISLLYSLWEVLISTNALNVQLKALRNKGNSKERG